MKPCCCGMRVRHLRQHADRRCRRFMRGGVPAAQELRRRLVLQTYTRLLVLLILYVLAGPAQPEGGLVGHHGRAALVPGPHAAVMLNFTSTMARTSCSVSRSRRRNRSVPRLRIVSA
jgi:hypothetical protein